MKRQIDDHSRMKNLSVEGRCTKVNVLSQTYLGICLQPCWLPCCTHPGTHTPSSESWRRKEIPIVAWTLTFNIDQTTLPRANLVDTEGQAFVVLAPGDTKIMVRSAANDLHSKQSPAVKCLFLPALLFLLT
jgi:hypothetical protein